jgi:chemotaxis-related protein WspD
MRPDAGDAPLTACWREVGVAGNRRCPELARVVHCRNCAVLARAAQAFLDRPAPPGYADFFTAVVAMAPPASPPGFSAFVFRLGREWLAIDTAAVVEIADLRPVRRIAHRSRTLVRGLVNIRGQLHLTLALDDLLELSPTPTEGRARDRLVVIARNHQTWVFRADEVHGVARFADVDLIPAPATLPGRLAAVTRGVVPWGERRVTCLTAEALFEALLGVAG